MMINDNKKGLDRPCWEQLDFAKATGIAGTNIENDGERFIYAYFQTSATAAQFWAYDTWNDCWIQLATPATQTGTVANMVFTRAVGGQFNGKVYGSIYLFVGNGSVCYLYKYDIATNVWSANLGTTNVPAAFATDCYLMYPSVIKNNFETAYHSGVTRTITASAAAAVGATSVSVAALPEALVAGTCLRFGTFNLTITANVLKGATNVPVSALPQGISAGAILKLTNGKELILSAAAVSGATSVTVYPLMEPLFANDVVMVEQFAVLTAAAAAAATSITVSPLLIGIASAATAGYYGQMYMIGNNATVMYRYNIGANTWYTTSANSGTPAMPAVPGAAGAGCSLKFLPGFDSNKLFCFRGGATANIYVYDLVNNTWATLTYYPNTETFTAGTFVAARDAGGKQDTLLIQKDATMRVYEFNPAKNRMEPKLMQWLYPTSTAVVGDKGCIVTTPDGVDYYYILLHSSPAFLRVALLDS